MPYRRENWKVVHGLPCIVLTAAGVFWSCLGAGTRARGGEAKKVGRLGCYRVGGQLTPAALVVQD